ncbi:MAG: sugar 3,4-ketoisomerase [Chitinophagales bacterium]
MNSKTDHKHKVGDCKLIELPKIQNRSGNITPIHNLVEIPFNIERVFYLYDIPGGESRGAHAHKTCHQFLIAASGSFEIMVDDGQDQKTIMLNRPYTGFYIPPAIWAKELNFSSGAICLVLTSQHFNESDYIRSHNEFLNYRSVLK